MLDFLFFSSCSASSPSLRKNSPLVISYPYFPFYLIFSTHSAGGCPQASIVLSPLDSVSFLCTQSESVLTSAYVSDSLLAVTRTSFNIRFLYILYSAVHTSRPFLYQVRLVVRSATLKLAHSTLRLGVQNLLFTTARRARPTFITDTRSCVCLVLYC